MPSDKISNYQGNSECDFVIQREEAVVELIQVTWDMSDAETKEREIRGIIEASSATGCDNMKIITIDYEDVIYIENKKIDVIPAWKWMSAL